MKWFETHRTSFKTTGSYNPKVRKIVTQNQENWGEEQSEVRNVVFFEIVDGFVHEIWFLQGLKV
jgi:hypothetical protein